MRWAVNRSLHWAIVAVLLSLAGGGSRSTEAAAPAPPYKPTADELRSIRGKTGELAIVLKRLAGRKVDDALLADVEIYYKAAAWIVRYGDDEFFSKRYVPDTLAALDRGLARAKELSTGKPAWPAAQGQLVRAYRSRVDGSVQPYALTIPASYDGRTPVRLDLVLHGRAPAMNEVNFIAGHDSGKAAPPEQDYIKLEVFGRWNNAYRWAGETDVFEALASVQQRYRIDPRRIVLRGFSMGGAGAWHLGLHYPDRWAAVEAGAGFTDTHRYTKTEAFPPYQEAPLHIYDAVDYARNASDVPFVGYGGEIDAQLQATLNVRQRLVDEGFHFTADGLNWIGQDLGVIFLVGPKTGHKFHPDSKKQSDTFIEAALAKGRRPPQHIRFVTWTTRYNECFGLKIEALAQHYQQAELDAQRAADGSRLEISCKNVARLALGQQARAARISIDGSEVPIAGEGGAEADLVLEKTPQGWAVAKPAAGEAGTPLLRKTHGLQGPIDDALADSFLCVRGTGQPYQRQTQRYAEAALAALEHDFAKWMRGDVRVKDDTHVTEADIARYNLILFGDPGSNKLLARIAPRLPIRWTKEAITVGAQSYPAEKHVLVMIYPNPLNPQRYVVLGSGHTFGDKDFRGTNALLYPRLGDYAVLELGKTAAPADATVATAGLFGEHWELSGARSR